MVATGATDYPPGPFEPLLGIQSCVTRTDSNGKIWGPSQKISVEEALKIYTINGAYASFEENIKGSIQAGKLADLVVVEENPLANLKVLYGTGAIKLDENNKPVRAGGVRYTIKDGIIFDAKKLLEDVRHIVREAKEKEKFKITQPGTR